MMLRRLLFAAGLALLSAGQAVAAWNEAKTKHFIIYSEQSPKALHAFAERLERFDAAVRLIRRMPDPELTDGGKVTIYVLPTLAALQKLHSDRSSNVYGFYIPRASGSSPLSPTASTEDPRCVPKRYFSTNISII